jgi:putative endonuclease
MSTSRSYQRSSDLKRRLGRLGEEAAARWYRERGWEQLARNWRCREGEIDLVCTRGQVIAFVEVKARSGMGFGAPVESVTPRKAARLRRLASRFLSAHPGLGARTLRFDMAAVSLSQGERVAIEVIHDAF